MLHPCPAPPDSFQLGISDAKQAKRPAHRLCALLAQREVVLTATGIVGMPFDHRMAAFLSPEVTRMGLDHGLEVRLDDEAVVVEINDARAFLYGRV
jgi:hypothetical protein